MPQTDEISFTIGDKTHEIIRYEVVDQADKYDSVSAFYRRSIAGNVKQLHQFAAGGRQARQLIELLTVIRGINERIPEDEARAALVDEDLSGARPRVELSPEHLEILDRLTSETGLSRSEIIRRCLFRQLHRLGQRSGLLSGWREKRITRTWEEVRTGLHRPRVQCHDILRRRFVDEYEQTLRNIEQDPGPFEAFAEEYTSNFYGTDGYQELEQRGSEPLSYVENTIEEQTDYSIRSGSEKDGFLADLLEEA
ncbi:ribbon-helix-helix protein, CopG family [Halobacterium zhouii]|uniref:ribbon-helix-helix protein, CopG family n=1 Tax=Halobacterium zhouii TaxID=2902624 RepID=UPI001E5F10DA|nr:ribbon-helix-helix protein, CopG family [Halobacterium zhouii]